MVSCIVCKRLCVFVCLSLSSTRAWTPIGKRVGNTTQCRTLIVAKTRRTHEGAHSVAHEHWKLIDIAMCSIWAYLWITEIVAMHVYVCLCAQYIWMHAVFAACVRFEVCVCVCWTSRNNFIRKSGQSKFSTAQKLLLQLDQFNKFRLQLAVNIFGCSAITFSLGPSHACTREHAAWAAHNTIERRTINSNKPTKCTKEPATPTRNRQDKEKVLIVCMVSFAKALLSPGWLRREPKQMRRLGMCGRRGGRVTAIPGSWCGRGRALRSVCAAEHRVTAVHRCWRRNVFAATTDRAEPMSP